MRLLSDGSARYRGKVVDEERVEVRIKKGVDRKQAGKGIEKGSKLFLGQLLHCCGRYCSDSVVLESRDFVERAFQSREEWFVRSPMGRQSLVCTK